MLTRQCILMVLNELVCTDRWAYKHDDETVNYGREQHEWLLISRPVALYIILICETGPFPLALLSRA